MRSLHWIASMLLCAAPAMAQGAFLGVELAPQQQDEALTEGALVTQVQQPSAASLMGLLAGDVVIQVAETPISSTQALVSTMRQHLPGDIVTLKVLREGQELSLMGILGRRPGSARGAAQAPLAWAVPEYSPELQHDMERIQSELDALRFAWPEMEGMQEMPAFPEMPMWPTMPEMPEMPEMPKLQFQFQDGFGTLPVDPADGSMSVQLRYPGDTSPEDRERLTKEAQEKYGEQVEITFEGQGRSVMIQRTQSHSSANAPEQRHLAPNVPEAPLPPREQMRDF